MRDAFDYGELAERLRRERPGYRDAEDFAALLHRGRIDDEEEAARRLREAPDPDEWYVGLDLGQLSDYSALTVLRKSAAMANGRAERTESGDRVYNIACVHIERWPLGTGYPAIVKGVAQLMGRPEIPGAQLVVDATGVGRPVVDMFRAAGLGSVLTAISITGGNTYGYTGGGEMNVSKVLLISAAQASLSSGRLKIAKGLAHADTLKKELLDYRVKVTGSAHEIFEARAGAHDDIVLALALPVWFSTYAFYSAGAF